MEKHHKFSNFVFANLNYLGIFAPLKNRAVKLKIKISKRMILRLVLFTALIGIAILLDNYFEKNPVKLDNIADESGQTAMEHGTIYLFTQNSSASVKTSVQKTPDRKNFQESHDKLLQKYHQLRNYHVKKMEARIQKKPFILTCHFLIFRSYHFTLQDNDVPPVA